MRPEATPARDAEPQPTDAAFRVEAFGPYFRGLLFGTRALASRMHAEQDAAEVRDTSQMAASFAEAWKRRRAAGG